MSEQDHIERVWQLIEKIGVCMLTTQAVDRLHAPPVEADSADKEPGSSMWSRTRAA